MSNSNNDQIQQLLQCIIQAKGNSKQNWINILSFIKSSKSNELALASELKGRFNSSNTESFILLLNLIDYLVEEGPMYFRMQIASKEFITVLLYLLKLQNHSDVQKKLLALIKKWGLKYESQKEQLPNFNLTYIALLNKGVCFPKELSVDYLVYLEDKPSALNQPSKDIDPNQMDNININEVIKENEKPKSKPQSKNAEMPRQMDQSNINSFTNEQPQQQQQQNLTLYGDILLDLNPNSYGREYRKLMVQLSELVNLISLENDMIDSADYKDKNNLNDTLREIKEKLQSQSDGLERVLDKVADDKVMMLLLGINEDIKKVLQRYKELMYQKKPTPFVSSFKEDYTQYDLSAKSNKEQQKLQQQQQQRKEEDSHDIDNQINKASDDINSININQGSFYPGKENEQKIKHQQPDQKQQQHQQHNTESNHPQYKDAGVKEDNKEDNRNEIGHYNINEF